MDKDVVKTPAKTRTVFAFTRADVEKALGFFLREMGEVIPEGQSYIGGLKDNEAYTNGRNDVLSLVVEQEE